MRGGGGAQPPHSVPRALARPYLVRAPVPEGRHGHSDQDPGPREVGGQRVSEDMKGVLPGQPAAAVRSPVGGQGQEVLLHQAVQPSDRGKTWTSGGALEGAQREPGGSPEGARR